jgi:hypothetical protein
MRHKAFFQVFNNNYFIPLSSELEINKAIELRAIKGTVQQDGSSQN